MRTLSKREDTSPQTTTKRRSALNLLEERIRTATKDAFLSQINASIDLGVIREDKLYEIAGCKTFNEYIDFPDRDGKHRFLFNSKEANRMIACANIYQNLQLYKKQHSVDLPLPDNFWKLRSLSSKPVSKATPLYFDALRYAQKCETEPTADFIREFLSKGSIDVESTVTRIEYPPVKNVPVPDSLPDTSDNGDEGIDLSDMVSSDDVIFPDDEDVPPLAKRYIPDAQTALDRIDRFSLKNIFPQNASAAIRSESIAIDQDDLAIWGRMQDDVFIPVGRLIFRTALTDRPLTFTEARRFYFKTKDPDFLDRIVLYAIQEGSSVIKEHNGFIITIKPSPVR